MNKSAELPKFLNLDFFEIRHCLFLSIYGGCQTSFEGRIFVNDAMIFSVENVKIEEMDQLNTAIGACVSDYFCNPYRIQIEKGSLYQFSINPKSRTDAEQTLTSSPRIRRKFFNCFFSPNYNNQHQFDVNAFCKTIQV